VHHRCQRHRWQMCHRCLSHRWQIAAGINDTGGNLPLVSTTPAANFATSCPCVVDTSGKFATGVVDTSGKFAAGICSLIWFPLLPPVSTTPAANLPPVSQIMGTISVCRHLKVNLKAKIYMYVSSTTQR
jgi:hypothetical protein